MTYPTFDQELAKVLADFQAAITIYNRTGQRIPVDTRQGSVLLALARRMALLADTFYGVAETLDAQSNIDTATGIYLERIGAAYDTPRDLGSKALWPMRLDFNPPPSVPLSLPVGHRVAAPDSQGNLTLLATLPQDPTLPNGTAAIVPAGIGSYWVFYVASTVGESGNIGSGQLVAFDPLNGVTLISNPPVPDPAIIPAPSTQYGTGGSSTIYLAISALGLTGTTLASPPRMMTNANIVGLDATHGYLLTWPDMPDAVGGFRIWQSGDNINWTRATTLVPAGATSVDTRTLTTWTADKFPTENSTNRGVGGIDLETDEHYRGRIKDVLPREAYGTADAITAAVEALTSVKKAYFLDLYPSPGTFTVRVLPYVHPLSAPQQTEITTTIDQKKAGGIQAYWSEITATLVTVTYSVQMPSGTANPLGYIDTIDTAIQTFFDSLELGDPVRYESLAQAILASLPQTKPPPTLVNLTMATGGSTYGRGQTYLDVPANSALVYGTDNAHIAATVS